MRELERIGKLLALSLWALVIISLGILFGGCTSTSSISRFYFLKVSQHHSLGVGGLILLLAKGELDKLSRA
jgi:hypothetical protein